MEIKKIGEVANPISNIMVDRKKTPKKYILANGCSFTDPEWGLPKKYSEAQGIKTYEKQGHRKWPEWVSEKLDFPVLNIGRTGNSNEAIAKTTIGRICNDDVNKPEAIMILWTSGGRTEVLNEQVHYNTIFRIIHFAAHFVQLHPLAFRMFLDDRLSPVPLRMSKIVITLINEFYPGELRKLRNKWLRYCKDHYVEQEYFDDLLAVFESVSVKDRDGLLSGASLRFIMANMVEVADRKTLGYYDFIVNAITDELKPILDVYYACKQENIPLYSISSMPLNWNVDDVVHFEYNINSPNAREGNIFAYAIIKLIKLAKMMNENFIEHPYFKKIDKLVATKEMVYPYWPPHRHYSKSMMKWLKGWKPIARFDQHPHPDTHPFIADEFIKLLKGK